MAGPLFPGQFPGAGGAAEAAQAPGTGTVHAMGHSSSLGHLSSGTHPMNPAGKQLAGKQLAGNRIGKLRLSRKEVLEKGAGRDPLPISQTNQGGRTSSPKAFPARCPRVCPPRHSEPRAGV